MERFKNTGLQDLPLWWIWDTRREKSAQQNKVSKCVQKVRIWAPGPTWGTVTIAIPEKSKQLLLQAGNLKEIFFCSTTGYWRFPVAQTNGSSAHCLNETHQGHEAFSLAPLKTKTLKCSMTPEKQEHRSKDKTTGQCKKRTHGSGNRHGHRSGQPWGSHAKRGHQTHWHNSSKHRGYSHGHSHGTGHLKRRLGIMVMTGPGTRRTSVDNVKAVWTLILSSVTSAMLFSRVMLLLLDSGTDWKLTSFLLRVSNPFLDAFRFIPLYCWIVLIRMIGWCLFSIQCWV